MAPVSVNGSTSVWKDLVRAPHRVLLQPGYFPLCAVLVFCLEVVVLPAIIWKVPYTEIDWVAYMQEVEGFLNGTWDYTQLKGDTGPLVYPAGFVYIYSGLYYLTGHGENIKLAQWVFAVVYLVNLAVVLSIYSRIAKSVRLPPYLLIFLCCTAYRVHSIFVLRMFNDPIAVLLLYVAVSLLMSDWWTLGCAVFSLAVSVKMNILLYSPGLLVLLLLRFGWRGTLPRLVLCAVIQVMLGMPFLMTNPLGYVSGAFNLGRQFLFKWTVNWRFMPEAVFLHRGFHLSLLAAHLVVMAAFALRQWTSDGGFKKLLRWSKQRVVKDKNSPVMEDIVWTLFTSNFIGMAFSRSLHYQFYIWYFHTLPLLLWTTPLPSPIRVILLLLIEYCWNVYPSTTVSSLLLHLCHFAILAALYVTKRSRPDSTKDK